MDLNSEQLIVSVNKAHHYERSWRARGPRPARGRRNIGAGNNNNHYLDNLVVDEAKSDASWYRILQSPPYEEVDWLSPITSSYILCATKTGKVVCWDVQTDRCLAEWVPGEKWELWKCRVEFDEKVVYFTMAKVLNGSYDDTRLMHFSLMRLSFVDSERNQDPSVPSPAPSFSNVTSFRTTGVVMNIFLLDPGARLLSAFIWVSESNTIGLYVLLDWEREEYVFVDTGIECVISSNWSCILYANNIVIHCEDSDSAFQHFYPLSHLEDHVQKVKRGRGVHPSPEGLPHEAPLISGRVRPWESIVKRFKFPRPVKIDRRLSGRPFSPPGQEGTLVDDDDERSINFAAGLSGTSEAASDNFTSTSTSTAVDSSPPHSSPPLSQASVQTPSVNERTSELQWDSPHPDSPPTPPPTLLPTDLSGSNPFPFPPWYPESAHFVRQWWPSLPGFVNSHAHYRRRDDESDDESHLHYSSPYSLSRSGLHAGTGTPSNGDYPSPSGLLASAAGPGGVPRVSCTVVLLACHDQATHRTRFVLMQHYFRVPMRGADWVELRQRGSGGGGLGDLSEGIFGNGHGAYNVNNTNGHVNGTAGEDDSDDSDEGAGNVAGPSGSGNSAHATTATHGTAGGGTNAPLELYMIDEPPDGSVVVEAYTRDQAAASEDTSYLSVPSGEEGSRRAGKKRKKRKGSGKPKVDEEDDPMSIWYVAEPFEVVCVLDSPSSDDEGEHGEGSDDEGGGGAEGGGGGVGAGGGAGAAGGGDEERGHERPRPLVAVDFGHAVWIEYVPDEEQQQGKGKEAEHHHEDDLDELDENEPFFHWHSVRHERANNGIGTESDPKRLRFVTFPPYIDVYDGERDPQLNAMGEVRTLEVPAELDLDNVETINIDQSQGAVILSVKSGQIFILCYE
ncbi:hypothetical protein V5O48_007444 [Marasmius crinis-equi]|uniref:Uncharacterized protein n=1 Tax=Marasmius crinis-equi TaxID=585013 RepID=A0ABR3FGR0_9AGAR